MLDIKWIRENKEKFDILMQKRNIIISSDDLLHLDQKKRDVTTSIQNLQAYKNAYTKNLRGLKEINSLEFNKIKNQIEQINKQLSILLKQKIKDDTLYNDILSNIPNLPANEVPYGRNESMNKLVREYRAQAASLLRHGQSHYNIGKKLGMMDFKQTAKISGSRFVTLKGKLAKLARAISSFMIDIHTEVYGCLEVAPPLLVKPEAMYNVGQLPKFSAESYLTINGDYRLIPTGEVPLTNLAADSIQRADDLPQRYVAYTECFRSEAGSAGKDTKGMIRNHQFGKVELVSITTNEESHTEHERMLASVEDILKRLDISYRVMLLCTGDMGFAAQKTYDIEVWLPGEDKYREISSISNCGDFQARRMKARYKEGCLGNNVKTKFVHTLNGSGLAVGRTMVAILENYQNYDGSVTIPTVLIPYMGGDTKIEKNIH